MLRKSFYTIALVSLVTSCSFQSNDSFQYKVGILGAPSSPDVEWNDNNMELMKELGFNTLQLNIAWGYRPADNALILEDVIAVPDEFRLPVDNDSTLNQNNGGSNRYLHSKERIAIRAAELKHRIAMCEKHDMRTIFHFGAPYVAYPAIEPLSQCISDVQTIHRYEKLLELFAAEFKGVDDLLLYTYDQNAWLCSENGPCDKCYGKPLDKRVADFVNALSRKWHQLNPDGKLWWEPWEISAGQTYKALELLDSTCVGLSVHSSITEVQIASVADRWFKNVVALANQRNIPVLGEVWLGTATEEIEPYIYLPSPLATLRALRAMNSAGKLAGIKEYYGNIPNREDPNLRMSSIFFKNPQIDDQNALKKLATPYNGSSKVQDYWKLSSEVIEMYPWDISWFAREVGRSDPHHLLTEATLKGASWETPSWQSNRRAAFMRTVETDYPHFWMMEDAQLRFDCTAQKAQLAIDAGNAARGEVPEALLKEFDAGLDELKGFRLRCLAYVYHIRESNICKMLRTSTNESANEALIAELKDLLRKDHENQGSGSVMDPAIKLLDRDVEAFLGQYFLPPVNSTNTLHFYFNDSIPAHLKTVWTLTSR